MPIEVGTELTFDISRLLEGYDELIRRLKQVEDQNQKLQKLVDRTFDGADKDVSEYADSLQEAANEAVDASKKQKELNTTMKSSIKDFRIFGVSLNSISGQYSKWSAALGTSLKSLKSTTGALKLFKVALVSTGIGAIVVALGSLVALLTKTQGGMDAVGKVMASVGSVVGNITDGFINLGRAIVSFGKGNFSQGVDDLKKSASSLSTELIADAKAAYELEAAMQNLKRVEAAKCIIVQVLWAVYTPRTLRILVRMGWYT